MKETQVSNVKPQNHCHSGKTKMHECPLCLETLTFQLEVQPEKALIKEQAHCKKCSMTVRNKVFTLH